MLVLFETPAGYAIFKLLDEKKLLQTENLYKEFESADNASKILKIKHFEKFEDMTEALAAATAAIEGKVSKKLKKLLKKVVVKEAHEQLAVADAKLGNVIKDKLNISCVSNTAISELMRCIRAQAESLIGSIPQKEMVAMALGLAHSLSRYKLKFSPDKVDTMIVQAVSLLDDLDKELNNYIMRCREWYGWHFPELGKIITDNLVYVKTVKTLGTREEAASCSFGEILPEDVEEKVKEAAEISMGTEISEEDISNIHYLCDQVIEMTSYRTQLYEYLKNRMTAIAPNLTVLVGDLVGARLIAHAGSLLNLAKHPASTVQILGAEKALFRAFKTKHDTPKYGLLYHAQLIGQTAPKLKGKVARMLASKAALSCRIDALGDETTQEHGIETKAKLLTRMKALEETGMRRISGMARSKAKMEKYESKSEIVQYPVEQDVTEVGTSKKRKHANEEGETPQPKKKKMKKEKPADESNADDLETSEIVQDESLQASSEKKKKKKKKIKKEKDE